MSADALFVSYIKGVIRVYGSEIMLRYRLFTLIFAGFLQLFQRRGQLEFLRRVHPTLLIIKSEDSDNFRPSPQISRTENMSEHYQIIQVACSGSDVNDLHYVLLRGSLWIY